MHPNATRIEQFYASFGKRDHAGMLAAYAPNVVFADEVFSLQGKRAGAMWHMLCESGKDLEVVASAIQADDEQGQAHWEARYTFSATGRKVHNIIEARFKFQAGAIVEHWDSFDFWRWSSQALGPAGVFLGWAPPLRSRVQQTARRNLERFIAAHPQYQG